jgi:hypothetical protein
VETFNRELVLSCRTKDYLDYKLVRNFQGNIKSRTESNVEHIIRSIERHGFSFPLFVWRHDAVYDCLDGHGRLLALKVLDDSGVKIPLVPVVFVDADSELEARRKLVEVNNLNGTFVESAFIDFVSDLDLNLVDYNIPDLDLEKIDKKLREQLNNSVKGLKVVCPDCAYEFEAEV